MKKIDIIFPVKPEQKRTPPRYEKIKKELEELIKKNNMSNIEVVSFLFRALDGLPPFSEDLYNAFLGKVKDLMQKEDYGMALHYLDFLIRDSVRDGENEKKKEKLKRLYELNIECCQKIKDTL